MEEFNTKCVKISVDAETQQKFEVTLLIENIPIEKIKSWKQLIGEKFYISIQ